MSWQKVKLGEVCHFVRGPFGGALKKDCFVDDGYAVYEQQHAIYNQFEDIRYFIDEEKFNELKRFKLNAGDLIMSCSGTMGKIAIVPENIKVGIINQALLKLTPSSKIDINFLKYWLKSESFQFVLNGNTHGAAIKNVASVSILKEIEIPLPPLDEQKRIAAILDKADAIRRKRQQAINLAEDFLRSVFLDMFGDPVTNPKGWEVKTLNDVASFIGGSTLPKTEEYVTQTAGIAAFKVGDMNSEGNETYLTVPREWASEYDKKHAYAPKGTIVLPKRGGAIGTNKKRVTSIEAVLDPNLMGVVPNEGVSLEYLYFWFKMLDLNTLSNGSSVPQLNKKDLSPLKILIANDETNLKFNKVYSDIEKLKKKLMTASALSDYKFNSLSQKAFAGEL